MEESSSLLRGYVNIFSPSYLKPNISVYISFLWKIHIIAVKYVRLRYVYLSLSVYYIFMVRLAVYI